MIDRPLWPTWAGPFSNNYARPLQPRYTLPACYRVVNTHREEEKASSFSDETLFYIFYTRVRDVMQEVAATELYVHPLLLKSLLLIGAAHIETGGITRSFKFG